MAGLVWGPEQQSRLDAIRDDLAQVSTASAFQLLAQQGWRNTYMQGLLPLEPLGLGVRLVGRARTCRYLMRRGPEGQHNPAARRTSAEITLIESIEPGDFFCVDALGVPTAGIIGDILATRLKYRGTIGGDHQRRGAGHAVSRRRSACPSSPAMPPLRERPGCRRGRLRRAVQHGGRLPDPRRHHPRRR